jgi:hypothetical protein
VPTSPIPPLTTFLLSARPAIGRSTAPDGAVALAAAAALLIAALAAIWTRRPRGSRRAFLRGAAAGVCFGVNGLLLKQLLAGPVTSIEALGTAAELAAVATAGIVLSQAAFVAGPLVESLPVATVLEPAIGVLLAGPLFGEALHTGASARLGELAGALLLGVGLIVLARRGPAVDHDAGADVFRRRSDEPSTVMP